MRRSNDKRTVTNARNITDRPTFLCSSFIPFMKTLYFLLISGLVEFRAMKHHSDCEIDFEIPDATVFIFPNGR